MIEAPSISSLFHEVFESEWPSDDPSFLAEVRRYESIIRRLLSLDSQLTNYIQLQPLLEFDQIGSTPVIQTSRKTQLIASCEPLSHQTLFQLTSSPIPLTDIFSSITLEAGGKSFSYSASEKSAEFMKAQFDSARMTQVKLTGIWGFPLKRVSPAFQKFLGSPVSTIPEIASKILAHIDSRSLCDSGEVRCDGTMRSLAGVEKFQITNLMDIISRNVAPLEPFTCTLDLPQSCRAFTIIYPGCTPKGRTFSAMKLPDVPVRRFFESILDSKEQLLAIKEFSANPEVFVDEMVVRESRCQDVDEVAGSSYFFLQPWVLETSSDLLKSSEYMKLVGRKVQVQPQVKT
jgi:hypothetical protein